MKNKEVKNFAFNMIGSTCNAVISLFLLIFVTRINGIKTGGIFSFAFSTACVFQVIATYSGRTYQVTELDKKFTDSDFVFSKIVCCITMLVAVVLFLLLKNYNIEKNIVLIILTIYKLLEALIDVFYGIFQKNGDLYKVGISLFLKSFFGVGIFLISDLISHNLSLSLLLFIAFNILVILFYDIRCLKLYDFHLSKINKDKILKILRSGFFTFSITLLTQYILSASKYSIDAYLTDEFQTIYGIIIMPATAIILCGQFIIHPFLNKLTQCLKCNNLKKFNLIVLKLCLCIFLFGVVGVIVANLVGIPFLQVLYNVNLKDYSYDLTIIISGASLYGIAFIISNSLITLRDTFSQFIMFLITSLFSFYISNKFILSLGIHGASKAYLYTMIVLFALFTIYYLFRYVITKKGGQKYYE